MADLIDRKKAIDAICSECSGRCIPCESYPCGEVEALERLPSAEPERKTGKWEMKPDPYGFFDEIPVCSECGCTTRLREVYKFCPNCGASMTDEEGAQE